MNLGSKSTQQHLPRPTSHRTWSSPTWTSRWPRPRTGPWPSWKQLLGASTTYHACLCARPVHVHTCVLWKRRYLWLFKFGNLPFMHVSKKYYDVFPLIGHISCKCGIVFFVLTETLLVTKNQYIQSQGTKIVSLSPVRSGTEWKIQKFTAKFLTWPWDTRVKIHQRQNPCPWRKPTWQEHCSQSALKNISQ